jgi:hypothetical protein
LGRKTARTAPMPSAKAQAPHEKAPVSAHSSVHKSSAAISAGARVLSSKAVSSVRWPGRLPCLAGGPWALRPRLAAGLPLSWAPR